MPRDNSKVFYYTPGNDAVSGAPVRSAQFNTRMAEIREDLNTMRPVEQGGTAAGTAAGARANLGVRAATETPGLALANEFTNQQNVNTAAKVKATYGGSLDGSIEYRGSAGGLLGYLTWDGAKIAFISGTAIYAFNANGAMQINGGVVYHSLNKPTPQDIGAGAVALRSVGAPSLMRNTSAVSIPAGDLLDGQFLVEVCLIPGGGSQDGAPSTTGWKWRAMSFCPANRIALFIRAS